MIKSPKEKFQESASCLAWEQITVSKHFDAACDSALLQMQYGLFQDDNFVAHQQMVGAMKIIRILKTIHEVEKQPTETTNKGLNYQAGV